MDNERGRRLARAWTVLLLLAVMGSSVAQDARYGSWLVSWQVDPISDVNRSFIAVFATEHPVLANRSALVVRCATGKSRGVEVFVNADDFLTTGEQVRVDYRFGDRQPHVGSRWSPSTDGTGAFLPAGLVADFVQEGLATSELVWRVYDYSGSPSLYRFSMNGFNDALAALGCYVP